MARSTGRQCRATVRTSRKEVHCQHCPSSRGRIKVLFQSAPPATASGDGLWPVALLSANQQVPVRSGEGEKGPENDAVKTHLPIFQSLPILNMTCWKRKQSASRSKTSHDLSFKYPLEAPDLGPGNVPQCDLYKKNIAIRKKIAVAAFQSIGIAGAILILAAIASFSQAIANVKCSYE